MTNDDKRRNAPRRVPEGVNGKWRNELLTNVKNMGHNRALLTYSDGTQGYMLHTTVVAWRTPAGRIRLDYGGWPTITTRAAMKEALALWTGEKYVSLWAAGKRGRKTDAPLKTYVAGKTYEGDAFWIN